MSTDGAVDLVVYAFGNGQAGGYLCAEGPGSHDRDLDRSPQEYLRRDSMRVRIIGTRHGEKLYETLLNREEMASAEDLGDYYRIPADCRDLNYSAILPRENRKFSAQEDYNSHNTGVGSRRWSNCF